MNVTGYLLTFLELADCMRLTSTCRRLYALSNTPQLLLSFDIAQPFGCSHWSPRQTCLYHLRIDYLRTHPDAYLGQILIFDPEFSEILHIEHEICFSLYSEGVYLWHLKQNKGEILGVFPGPADYFSHVVTPGAVVVLGRKELHATHVNWQTMSMSPSTSYLHLFSSNSSGLVRIVIGNVVTIRDFCVSIFTLNLQPLQEIRLTGKIIPFFGNQEFAFAPSNAYPCLLLVLHATCYLVNTQKGTVKSTWNLKVQAVTQADTVTVTDGKVEKYYLLVLDNCKSVLSNGKLLATKVLSFKTLNSLVICFNELRSFVTYEANTRNITVKQTVSVDLYVFRGKVLVSGDIYVILEDTFGASTSGLHYITSNGDLLYREQIPVDAATVLQSGLDVVISGHMSKVKVVCFTHFYRNRSMSFYKTYSDWDRISQEYERLSQSIGKEWRLVKSKEVSTADKQHSAQMWKQRRSKAN